MSDEIVLLRVPAADAEFDGCLLDAFCEDEGFAFAKLEEVEWQMIQRTWALSRCLTQPEPERISDLTATQPPDQTSLKLSFALCA